MKKIKDIMSTDCVTVTLQDNLYEIALKMKQNDIARLCREAFRFHCG
ncbi:MAG: hypothetical protein K0Q59_1589 [Paenibacillus sp.]|nr:hypothetical protein [Paenibacillus sp.]